MLFTPLSDGEGKAAKRRGGGALGLAALRAAYRLSFIC